MILSGVVDVKKKAMKLILELLKDSKRSDRELANVLGVSQPTVSRTRNRLVKEGFIQDFTIIPDFPKIGYKILAIRLVQTTHVSASKEYGKVCKKVLDWLAKQPNIIMGGACEGMGKNSFIISLHKNYSDQTEFMAKLRRDIGEFIHEVHSVLVNLEGRHRLKPFSLKYLVEQS
jgi:DNA-binding Lrp family transcriptional regulator